MPWQKGASGTLEERLAEAQAKRNQLDQRMRILEGKRKTIDLRRRAKAEKIVLRILLEATASEPEFGEALAAIIRAADLKAEDTDAALWLLSSTVAQVTPTEAANAA